jgi:hypothetical protein
VKTNAKDYVLAAQQFFTAYDANDLDAMLALHADGALGQYAPYGRESVVPIRGGIDGIRRAFPNAVPNFRVKVIELIPAEGNTVVIQAEMSGPIPAEVPGLQRRPGRTHPPPLHSTFRDKLQNHTALQNHAFSGHTLNDRDTHHSLGQVIGTNHLVGEQELKRRVY